MGKAANRLRHALQNTVATQVQEYLPLVPQTTQARAQRTAHIFHPMAQFNTQAAIQTLVENVVFPVYKSFDINPKVAEKMHEKTKETMNDYFYCFLMLMLVYQNYQLLNSMTGYIMHADEYAEKHKHMDGHQHHHHHLSMLAAFLSYAFFINPLGFSKLLNVSIPLISAYGISYLAFNSHRRAFIDAIVTLDQTPLFQLWIDNSLFVDRKLDVLRAEIVTYRRAYLDKKNQLMEELSIARVKYEELGPDSSKKEALRAEYQKVLLTAKDKISRYEDAFDQTYKRTEEIDDEALPRHQSEIDTLRHDLKQHLDAVRCFMKDIEKYEQAIEMKKAHVPNKWLAFFRGGVAPVMSFPTAISSQR